MKIPKSFPLMGHTINVHILSRKDWDSLAEKYEDMEDACGFFVADDNLIVLMRQPKSKLVHTFYHELCHAVLYYMNSKLWKDEKFVDQLGGLLAQALEGKVTRGS